MKITIKILLLWALCATMQAQTLTRTVLPAAGSSSNPQLTWTLCEVSTERLSAGGYTLWQGFQVPAGNDVQQIQLNPGWNLISSNILPANADMLAILAPIAGKIDIVKDSDGKTTTPAFNINQIGNWSIGKGYQVKANVAAVLTIEGVAVAPENTPVALVPGWQIVPYLRNSSMLATSAFQNANPLIILAKNNAGQVYLPGSINAIGSLLPTQGYWLKANGTGQLIYPQN